MGTVSVIIPIYNVEKYLRTCVDSVIGQTYRDLQIILVDDGSTDRCGAICDAYAQKDDRVTVIHQENGGPSAARNNGMLHALGEYIIFVDADDQLFPLSIQSMVNYVNQTDAELVLGGYLDRSPYGEFEIYEFNSGVDTKEKLISAVINGTGGVLWAKLFRTEIIAANGIRLNNKVHFSEDMLFVLEYIQYVHKWGNVQVPVYMYNRQNESSLTKKKSKSLISSYTIFAVELKKILIQLGMNPEKAERIADQKIVGFIDDILKRAKHPKNVFKSVCGNDVSFAAIMSGNVILPKSIQYAMQNQWGYIYILNKRDELRSRISIIWHWLLRMRKNEFLCGHLLGEKPWG